MAINFSLRDFYDGATELIGIKSGLLLNRFQIANILLENYDDHYLKSDNLNAYVRIHASDFEDMLVRIRKRIGNLPEILLSQKAYEYMKEYTLKAKDVTTLASAASMGGKYLQKNSDLTVEELTELIRSHNGYNKKLSWAIATIAYERYDQSCSLSIPKSWDGGTELSKLYNCELNAENDFLEQKFIDYLAVNGHEIETIHWRNFERFCAEYFRKQGYRVILGPGTNDGGVDIRAYKVGTTAPDLMIQCKRYKEANKVSIETVKSFYSDVQYEGATAGLIATTSFIAEGGKKVCNTRGYNIKFAEQQNIKNWAREMWTYKK